MTFVRAAIAALVICSSASPQQPPDFEGRKVSSIEYPGVQPLDEKDLTNAQPIRVGEPFTREAAAEAIDRLFATGRFRNISVEADSAPDGGVIVRIVTEPQWFVGHVGVEGKLRNPPNRGNVVNVTRLNLAQPFDESMVPRAEERIRRLLERNGLYESTVSTQIERDPEAQQVHLTFLVKRGKRAHYDRPVIEGDPKLSESAIIRATGWKRFLIPGYREVTEKRTRDAVRGVLRKYQGQERLMAKVELRGLKYEPGRRKVSSTLHVEAGPKVKIRTLEAKVSKRKLKKYVPVYQEQSVDNDLLVEGARNLRDYFQLQGYYDTDVEFRQHPEQNDEVVIDYVISRGQRFKLVEAQIDGNRYFNTETIRERMFLEPAGVVRFRHGRYSEAMRNKDIENIENLYRANGFRDVKVTTNIIRDYKGKANDIAVTFHIEEGPQWFVSGLEIDGVKTLNRDEILALLSSMEGQPFSEVNVASDRNAILTAYYSNGFPDAAFRWAQSEDSEPNRVKLRYIVDEGRQRFIRDILVNGVRTTRMSLVNKRLAIKPGEPLSPLAVTDSQKQLYDTGVLAKVSAATQNPDGQTDHKYVVYDINEADRYNINVGFGAEFARLGGTSTDLTTPGGSTGFSPRFSFDVSRINLFGLGHFATVRGRISTLDKRGSFSYTAPRFQNVEGRNVTFTALWQESRDVRTFSSRREEASIQVSQQFTRALTGLFRYSWRDVRTSDVVIPTLLIPQLLQPVRIGMISANIAHDRRNDPADPTRGIFTTADLGVASNVLGSQRSFVRGLIRNSNYWRITRNTVLARETTFGAILPFHAPAGLTNQEAIPLPERFFGGGNMTHRGFPENQAGPRDTGIAPDGTVRSQPTGFPLGGNAVLFNMTEYRFPLIGDNINGVFFHDMGNVYTDIGSIAFRSRQRSIDDFNYMVHAAGFGIRYKTPVGPVRVDLSYSINPPAFLGFKGTTADLLQCNPAVPSTNPVCQPVRQNISHFQFFFSIGQTF